ncbi:MAG: diacylglycerol/lipid kinase family protein, partial [Terriglobia bacterium]
AAPLRRSKRPSLQPATLIYNPVAGRNPARRERQIREVAAVLKQSGIPVTLARTTAPGCATELARAAASAGAGLVLACGGDGTIHEVINGLCPGSIPLGILPGGTANIVANELGLPHGPVRAARELMNWRPRRIALGLATGWPTSPSQAAKTFQRYFLSVAGVGFDAYVIHRLGFKFKMSLGVMAYLLEGLRQVMRYPFPPMVCEVDGQRFEATFALVQRTSLYAGWFRTAPNQSIANPRFGLSLFRSSRRLRYLAYGAAVLTQRQLRDVDRLETSKVTFAPAHPGTKIFFELDGELVGILPATFEVAPEALTLLMPSTPGRPQFPS